MLEGVLGRGAIVFGEVCSAEAQFCGGWGALRGWKLGWKFPSACPVGASAGMVLWRGGNSAGGGAIFVLAVCCKIGVGCDKILL